MTLIFVKMKEQDNKSLQRVAYRTEIPLKSRYSHTTSLKKNSRSKSKKDRQRKHNINKERIKKKVK